MIRLLLKASAVLPEAWQDDGFGGRELRPLAKAAIKGTAGHHLDAAKHRWVNNQAKLTEKVRGLSGDAFDKAVLDHAPRVADRSAVGGGQVRWASTERAGKDEFADHNLDRIAQLVPDQATAEKVADHAKAMIVEKSGDTPERIHDYIRQNAEGFQSSRIKPHVKLAAAALGSIETEANSRTVGAYEAKDIAEVALQRALHGHPHRPIASRLGDLRKSAGRPLFLVMRKGRDLGAVQRDALQRPVIDEFTVGGYLFQFRKSANGLSVLTVNGPACPMPYHMVVRGPMDARRQAPDIARTFADGRVPEEGVFRKEDDAALAVRYPGRSPANA